jgi:hypothetical protein
MVTKDRKENQLVLIEFSEEQQAFNFNLDGADKTAPSYMPIAWLPHLDAVRWTQEIKKLRDDHRLTLEEVVERSMTPLVRRGTVKLECVRHMHKIRRNEIKDLSEEKLSELFDQHTEDAKKFMLDDIFHTRLVEAGVYDNPDNKDIIVWAEVFVGVKDGINIDKELAGEDYEPAQMELKPASKFGHLETDPVTGKTKFISPKRKE